ncbi:MAG: FtsK/SpoIIIE domain-containing protein [Pirellulales bacterium]
MSLVTLPGAVSNRTSAEPNLAERERAAVRGLLQLADQLSREDAQARAATETARAAADQRWQQQQFDLEAAQAQSLVQADNELHFSQTTLTSRFDREQGTIEERCHAAVAGLESEIEEGESQAQAKAKDARWLAQSVFDAAQKKLSRQSEEAAGQLGAAREQLAHFEQVAAQHLLACRMNLPEADDAEPAEGGPSADPGVALSEAVAAAEASLQHLLSLAAPRVFQGAGLVWVSVALALVVFALAGIATGWSPLAWIGGSLAALVVLIPAAIAGLWWLARGQAASGFREFREHAAQAAALVELCRAKAEELDRRQRAAIEDQKAVELDRAERSLNASLANLRRRRDQETRRLTNDAGAKLTRLQQTFEQELERAINLHADQQAAARTLFAREWAAAETEHASAVAAVEARASEGRLTGRTAWKQGLAAASGELAAVRRSVDRVAPAWDSRAWFDWTPLATAASAVRFGGLTLDLRDRLAETDLVEAPSPLGLPALLPFPEGASAYVRSTSAGRRQALEFLQTLMLRMLTAAPAGKLKFTIVDPVGLGQNFASFMHLADFDEALVGHRIWTEPHHIEQRLADLTEHMENVIQKYLRNEFATIQDYNERAGEIAEPLRVLVVANFPTGFTDSAARRLASIAASGPRCGVLTLIAADGGVSLPAGLEEADLRPHASLFVADGKKLSWRDAEFRGLPLVVDPPPPAERCHQILAKVGAAALGVRRVEVPFETITPPSDRLWTADSTEGLDVPLGRVGATRLQHLRLGQGTAQHVLVAGKTGSGKSTLLHALVTNAALRYGPDQLEFYLIDFKQGVEFKSYVTHALPHARVVAIESEREFGLSVLERLDGEMHRRGELFRELVVQDLPGYRKTGRALPRIMLVIDEFQEFFVQDDRLAQQAALLLDRLVRQGRAFGIHVTLGSQTLGGAYTLARSTLGQMAVRIALACSEADASLILSEDNQAARLLARPGEAIYNDANGLVEGNHPFQTAWLADDKREAYLARIRGLAAERGYRAPAQPIVFEGMRPAEAERNETLAALLASRQPKLAPPAPVALLGDPLAIRSATSAAFPRRSGAHLLWLGHNEEAVVGMQCTALVSLAAQLEPQAGGPPQFVLVDGPTSLEGPSLLRMAAQKLPHAVRVGGPADAATLLGEAYAEFERRRGEAHEQPPLFVFLSGLARFRELRRQEDDFGFGRASEGRRPDQQLAELLRDGPSLGVHLLVWCDTMSNFQRWCERSAMKEFDGRVLLQMSAADSSLLVDSPAASQLGPSRALLSREDEGRLEKFRPFAPPSLDWLDTTLAALNQPAQ